MGCCASRPKSAPGAASPPSCLETPPPLPELFPTIVHRTALNTPSEQKLYAVPVHLQSMSCGACRLAVADHTSCKHGHESPQRHVAGVASVDAWLAQLDLSQYTPAFRAAGWVPPPFLLRYQPCQRTVSMLGRMHSCRRSRIYMFYLSYGFYRHVAPARRQASTRRPMAVPC